MEISKPRSRRRDRNYSAHRHLKRIIPLPFESSQLPLLTDASTLLKWATFTLDQRVTLAH